MNDLGGKRFEYAHHDLASSDVVFLSLKRSGRTWVRYFLKTYLERVTGAALSLDGRLLAATAASPAVGFHLDFFEVFAHEPAPVRILFQQELAARPLILLLRDPRDRLVSSYHYTRARAPLDFARNLPSDDIADFVASPIYGVERMAAYQALAVAFFQAHRMPKLLLTYERLWTDPEGEFRRLLSFLSLTDIDEAAFSDALTASRFARMQRHEIEISRGERPRAFKSFGVDGWTGDTNELKLRRGQVGGYADDHPELDRLTHFPLMAASIAQAARLDPVALSDTHYSVGAGIDSAAADRRHLLARQQRLEERIDELVAKAAQLRATLQGRDRIIEKLKARTARDAAASHAAPREPTRGA